MNEFNTDLGSGAKSMVDTAAQTAEQAIRSSQRVANQVVDRCADGLSVVHDVSNRLRETSRHATESTVGYIRGEPVKSMLLAAAAGAMLLAMLSLIGRRAAR